MRIASELNRALSDSYGNSGETIGLIINRSINAAIRHYESYRFRWNEVRRREFGTTTAYDPNVSLPADFIMMTMLEVIYSNRYEPSGGIERTTVEEVNELNYSPSLTAASVAIPAKYTIEGNLLVLAPPTNAARTLAGSFIRRFPPTSLTGSYTAQIPVAGSYSLTVTTTASHNSRINGWTTDGEELIRARAKADVLLNYLKHPEAMQEAAGLAFKGENFLSVHEMVAFKAIQDETFDAVATGRVKAYRI